MEIQEESINGASQQSVKLYNLGILFNVLDRFASW